MHFLFFLFYCWNINDSDSYFQRSKVTSRCLSNCKLLSLSACLSFCDFLELDLIDSVDLRWLHIKNFIWSCLNYVAPVKNINKKNTLAAPWVDKNNVHWWVQNYFIQVIYFAKFWLLFSFIYYNKQDQFSKVIKSIHENSKIIIKNCSKKSAAWFSIQITWSFKYFSSYSSNLLPLLYFHL